MMRGLPIRYPATEAENADGKGDAGLNTILLQYALEVGKTGSITQAANNLYMEQPNLSKAIKSLEEMMGAPIFRRTSKGVVPTEKGKIFLEYAKNILSQLEELEAVYKGQETEQNEFRLSIPRATYISEAFCRFVKHLDRSEEINLSLKETNSMETVADVVDEKCRMGIIRYSEEFEKYYAQTLKEQELDSRLIWKYEPVILMSGNHPLAKEETITCGQLKEYLEILHGDIKLSTTPPIKTASSDWNGEKRKRIYVYERGSQFNLLQTNEDGYMWVSPLPSRCLKSYGLIQRNCSDLHRRFRDVLIYRPHYKMSPYDEMFLKEIQMVKKEIIGDMAAGR